MDTKEEVALVEKRQGKSEHEVSKQTAAIQEKAGALAKVWNQ